MEKKLFEYQSRFDELLKNHVEKGYLQDPKIQDVLRTIPLNYILEEEQLERFLMEDRPAVFYYK